MARRKTGERSSVQKSKPRTRDYKTEYQRRIARAEEQGYSRDVARGHPKEGEVPASVQRQIQRGLRTPGRQLEARDALVDWMELDSLDSFVDMLREFGMSNHQAYSLWYGYEVAV